MDTQRIEQELAQARQERDGYIRQAERQIAVYDGAIMVLERLLQPTAEVQPANEG